MMKLVVALAFSTFVAPVLAQCPVPDGQAVTNTVQAMLDAAASEDASKLGTIFTPSFYAFDVGKRYDAHSFQDAIRKMHQSGTHISWRVTTPDVHITCATAWVAYINEGTLTESGRVMPLTWLESAELTYANNSWHVAFLESARASDPTLVGKSSVSTVAESTDQEITRLEKEVYSAIAAKDYDKIRLLIADDYVQREHDDETITRENIIDRLNSGIFNYESGVIGPISVDVLGDVAIAMYSADEHFTYAGKHISVHSYDLDVWTKRNGKWVQLRTQSANAADPPEVSNK